MALNSVKPITSSNATATNGSTTITVFSGVDCSKVFQGSILHLGGNNPVEAISGTLPNDLGESIVTLREAWTEATQTDKLLIFNTIEGLVGAIQKAQNIVEQTSGIEALIGTGFVEKTGENSYTTSTVTTQAKQILSADTSETVRGILQLGTSALKDTNNMGDLAVSELTLNEVQVDGLSAIITCNTSTPTDIISLQPNRNYSVHAFNGETRVGGNCNVSSYSDGTNQSSIINNQTGSSQGDVVFTLSENSLQLQHSFGSSINLTVKAIII